MKKNILSSQAVGKSGEELAQKFLKKKKYRIINRGYRLFRGEIDIIAYDEDTLVFIEVKTRRGSKFGQPEEAVTLSKQKQIQKIAQGFLIFNQLENIKCRFDVIALNLDDNQVYTIKHFINAF